MGTPSVQICFSTEDNAPTLVSCLEQLLRNVSLEPREETPN